ncbi:PAS domain-containing protein [Undibacterium sp. CY18W]|uniref:histidine kinase n=1 Tax=Undibacterium hunanense TaxID=2762292 RepID=A0ABR6ZN15_9BURK|nr:ATP-binding protein [Undibacterium hunanense]MBC3916979.1 PAS domain-containing protein [Undibacterium hunanense]
MSLLKPTSRPRLATLLTLGVSAVVLCTVLSALLLVDHFANNYAQKEAEQRLQQLSWQMRDQIDLVMQKSVGDVQLLSQLSQIRDAQDPSEIRRILDSLQNNFTDYAWIGLASPDGKVLASSKGLLEGQDVSQRPWFQQGKKALYAGDYHPALLLQKLLPYSADPWRFVDVAIPVRRADGSLRGVLGVHLSWNWARKLAQTILAPADQQYNVDIMIVRDDGTVLLGPKGMEEKKIKSSSLTQSRSGKTGTVEETFEDGKLYLTGYALTGQARNYPALQWSILVRQPKDIAMAALHNLEKEILLFCGLLGLILALVAALLARRASASLIRLSTAIEQRSLKRGGTAVTPSIPIVNAYHEAHLLSVTLADMVEKEERHLADMESANQSLETTVAERTHEIKQKASELELALQQQRNVQSRLQAITDNLPCIITFMDLEERYVFVNAFITSEFGVRPEQLIGKTLREVVGEEFYKPMAGYVKNVLAGQRASFEGTGELNKRTYYYQSVYVPAVNDRDEVEGFYAISFDIADRKRVEMMMNEFVSMVSHELRTPLTSINGALRLVAAGVAGEIPDKAKELTTVAMRNADRLLHLINDILDLEKIASGKMEFDFKVSALQPLIQDAISGNMSYSDQYGVSMRAIGDDAELYVNVDRDRYAQVLANLLSNAIKFSHKGGEVVVSVEKTADKVKVIVTDYGSGIPSHFHSKIFQKFSQVDSSNTRKKGGTGLGLNICKTIIEKMGGSIGFESTIDVGSKFFFELPLVPAPVANDNN